MPELPAAHPKAAAQTSLRPAPLVPQQALRLAQVQARAAAEEERQPVQSRAARCHHQRCHSAAVALPLRVAPYWQRRLQATASPMPRAAVARRLPYRHAAHRRCRSYVRDRRQGSPLLLPVRPASSRPTAWAVSPPCPVSCHLAAVYQQESRWRLCQRQAQACCHRLGRQLSSTQPSPKRRPAPQLRASGSGSLRDVPISLCHSRQVYSRPNRLPSAIPCDSSEILWQMAPRSPCGHAPYRAIKRATSSW
jgi:hypothetical protein